MLAYVWHKQVLSPQLLISLPTFSIHWLRFCWAEPQVVPLSTAGVKLAAVKGALEAVESLVDWLAAAVEPVLFAAAEVLVL